MTLGWKEGPIHEQGLEMPRLREYLQTKQKVSRAHPLEDGLDISTLPDAP